MAGERGGRRGVRWLIGLLIVLALSWCGYWYAVSRAAQAVIDRMASAVSAHGGSLSWTEQRIGGFPASLDLGGSEVKYAYAPASIAAGINRVTASAPLYYPGRVTAALFGPVVFDSPEAGIAVSASWLVATAGVDVGLSGLVRAGTSIDGLALEQTGSRWPIRHLAVSHADFAAAPGGGDDYRITATARDLKTEWSNGQTYPVLAGQLDLTAIHFGSSLGTDPKRTIAAWAAGGGKLRVDRLQVTAGAFTAAAAGDLTLDRQGLLSGKLTLSLTGLAALPDLVEQIRPGSRKRAEQVLAAVSAMSQPTPSGDGRQVPVFINKGIVSVMLLPVAVIPAVKL